jgi:hypothetical protein
VGLRSRRLPGNRLELELRSRHLHAGETVFFPRAPLYRPMTPPASCSASSHGPISPSGVPQSPRSIFCARRLYSPVTTFAWLLTAAFLAGAARCARGRTLTCPRWLTLRSVMICFQRLFVRFCLLSSELASAAARPGLRPTCRWIADNRMHCAKEV